MHTALYVRLLVFSALALASATLAQGAPSEAHAGGGCRGVPITEATGDTVVMEHTCFEPSILRVEPGQEVTWVNESSERHNVAGQNAAWGSYDELGYGESTTHAFEKAGTYAYYCFVHNGMIGVVVVGDGKGADAGAVSRGVPASEQVLASVPETNDRSEPDAPAAVTRQTGTAAGRARGRWQGRPCLVLLLAPVSSSWGGGCNRSYSSAASTAAMIASVTSARRPGPVMSGASAGVWK
jgi:plastocyanin